MFEARLKQASLFRKLIESLKEVIKEGNFDCSSNGISLQGIDPSFVALIQLSLRSDGFDHFRVDRNVNLGLSIENVLTVLKCAGANDSITLRAEDRDDKISFVFESQSGDRVSQFSLKLMDIDTDSFGIPNTSYHCYVKMRAAEFQRICKDLSSIGDTVQINVTKEGIKFSVNGAHGAGSIICKQTTSSDDDNKDCVQIKLEDEITQVFALRYLNQFSKATSLCDSVSLMMNEEVPLVVEYKIEDLGVLRFFLAPKIEDDNGGSSSVAADE